MQPQDGAYKTYHGEQYYCSDCALFKPAQCFRVIKGKRNAKCKEHEVVPCAACDKHMKACELDEKTISNYFQQQSNVICKECAEKGCTSRDPTKYKCMGPCQAQLGRERFEKNQLKNFIKQRLKTIVCTACLKEEDARERRIKATLRAKDAWKCTCKKLIHTEKCHLYPKTHGEKRWPGQNKGITEEGLAFLEKRPRR